MNNYNIGTRIKTLRKQHHMTLEELGNLCSVGKSTVRKWETGIIQNIKYGSICRLIDVLDTTPAYLLGFDEDDQRESVHPMNDMTIFQNPQFGSVRTNVIDGEVWFVAADVCKALDIQNHNHAVSRLDSDEKSGVAINDPHGRLQNTTVVNESGLYSLILTSRKPEAKAFKRWITHDVIPAIRQDGFYAAPNAKPPKLQNIKGLIEMIRETRSLMEMQGAPSHDIAVTAKSICDQYGVMLPECFIQPEKLNMQDVMDMIDFVFEHPREKGKKPPSYDDWLASRATITGDRLIGR